MLKGAMIVLNYLNDEERFEKWTATTKLMFNNCCDNIRKYREWWERRRVRQTQLRVFEGFFCNLYQRH